MSTNLYWEPADRKMKDLPASLKFALRKRYGGTVNETMTDRDIPYLEGLRDAGVEGAQALIEAIEKHEAISVIER